MRNVHTLNRQRLLSVVVLFVAIRVAVEIPALAAVATLVGRLTALSPTTAIRFAEAVRPRPPPARREAAGD